MESAQENSDDPAAKSIATLRKKIQEGTGNLVRSPYSPLAENALLQFSGTLWRICKFIPANRYLFFNVFFAVVTAVVTGVIPQFVIGPFNAMIKQGGAYLNKGGDINTPPEYSVFLSEISKSICIMLIMTTVQSLKNYCAMKTMVAHRVALTKHLHNMYMDPRGKSYFCMSALDKKVDSPEARITSDTDMMCQFGHEFVFGGVMNPELGMILQLGIIFWTAFFSVQSIMQKTGRVDAALASVLAPAIIFFVLWIPSLFVSKSGLHLFNLLQKYEAELRLQHTSIRVNGESIAFYGGEDSGLALLQTRSGSVTNTYLRYSWYRLLMDFFMLTMFYSEIPVPAAIGGLTALMGVPPVGTPGRKVGQHGLDMGFFQMVNYSAFNLMTAALKITRASLDGFKAMAYYERVGKMLEVMEEFQYLSGETGERIPVNVRKLECDEVIQPKTSASVLFKNANLYTPDAKKLLMEGVNFEMSGGERYMIMGPSGCGKSSLLRLLGKLWPLFQNPSGSQPAAFQRPGPRNLFFISQRPYLIQGSLRQQVAYPVWEDSLHDELDNESLKRVFTRANLSEIFERRKGELDATDLNWTDILSLGEQQRLQFCRLFWHFEWHQKHGNGESFFAVLDESTAALDTASEAAVYAECNAMGIGLLSVAHRPTVIRYHTKVLKFRLEGDSVRWEELPAATVAEEEARKVAASSQQDVAQETNQGKSPEGPSKESSSKRSKPSALQSPYKKS
jgi:putative ATP-binding cassette transporter